MPNIGRDLIHAFVPNGIAGLEQFDSFSEQGAVDMNLLRSLVDRYGLSAEVKNVSNWKKQDGQTTSV